MAPCWGVLIVPTSYSIQNHIVEIQPHELVRRSVRRVKHPQRRIDLTWLKPFHPFLDIGRQGRISIFSCPGLSPRDVWFDKTFHGDKEGRVVGPLVSMEEIRSSHALTEQLSVALQAILNFSVLRNSPLLFCYDTKVNC